MGGNPIKPIKPIKLVIGCNNYLFAEGLKKLLENDSKINTIGVFNEGLDLKEVVKLKPDIILADFNFFLSFPDSFAIDNHMQIILLDNRTELQAMTTQIPNLTSNGVVGILPPGTDVRLLKKAIKAVSAGELWIDRKTIKNILSSERSQLFGEDISFTKMERETITFICKGLRNKEIAQHLDISEQTVKSHLNRIYKKIGVSDRLQLALYYYRNGIIDRQRD